MQQNKKPESSGRRKPWLSVAICLPAIIVLAVSLEWLAGETGGQARLKRQIADIKEGKTDWLIDPDPDRLGTVLKDVECSSKVRWVTVTGLNMSDGRFARLREFPRLSIIWLEYGRSADVFLQNMRGMTTLEELSFHHAPFSELGAQHLRSFPRLTRLRIDNAKNATLKNLRGLTQLQLLEIDYGDIDDAGLESLADLSQLQTLDLVYATNVTSAGIKTLQKKLPQCKITVK